MNNPTGSSPSITDESWPLDPAVLSVASNAICVTGTGRSGTTLIGSLIHSFRSVEYAFEPPLLVNLFTRAMQIPDPVWKRLYAEYLYEEILLGALTARNLNFNEQDWSCIYKVKSPEEIRARWRPDNRKRTLHHASTTHVVAYKIPNITHALGKMLRAYPSTRVVVVARHPDEVARSVAARGWFRGDTMQYEVAGALRLAGTKAVPACLVGLEPEEWLILDEAERCHAIYAGCYESLELANVIVVDYGRLLASPHTQVMDVSRMLGLEWGQLTGKLVAEIRRQSPRDSTGTNEGGKWRRRALQVYDAMRSAAI